METSRRTFLRVLGAGLAAGAAAQLPMRAFADPPAASDDFFLFVHVSGGWDVMLSLDPRTERAGIIEPPSTEWVDTAGVTGWTDATLEGDVSTFRPVRPSGSNLTFGPAIGELARHFSRLTVINGIAVNTVSHPDGTAFAATGRHLAGGRMVASSIDTMMADAQGREALFPVISVNFPSAFVGDLDRRVVPLKTGSVTTVARSLDRNELYTYAADREAVTVMLSQEARALASRSVHPEAMNGLALQYDALRQMLGENLRSAFDTAALQRAYTTFDYRGRFQGARAVNLAFAVEAMKRDIVRCVSLSFGGVDTHATNYRQHAQNQQEIFNLLASLLEVLDATPHPTLMGTRLSDRTHVLVVSEFCRTPQINLSGGRDHYPNGSALVISPRFRGNTVFGRSDAEQLLPVPTRDFVDGRRAIAPPDVLATFASAFGVDPRRYMRDGEVVRELLRG